MTLADLILLAVAALAALGGWRRGLTGFGPGLLGLVLGVTVGSWIAGQMVPAQPRGTLHLLLVGAVVVGGALLGAGLGGSVGAVAGRGVAAAGLDVVDRVAGAVVRGALALVVSWLLVGVLGNVVPSATSWTARSEVLDRVADVLPDRQALITRSADTLGLPGDLVALVPSSASEPLDPAQVGATTAAASRSVVKIEGVGCGQGVEGSGFVVTDPTGATVVTNAHVVAGTRRTTVTDTGGTHAATVVLVDTDADLALLRVDGLDAPALVLAEGSVPNGTQGVVLGYPRDGELTAVPATVVQRLPVVQPGAGGRTTTREVYRLDAVVRAGNSGGPLVGVDGKVAGVVNARSALDGDTGFALTLSPLRTDLVTAAGLTGAADTGGCAAAA